MLLARKQQYTYVENIFSEVTNESAYWAGFIAADGYINNRRKSSVSLHIQLAAKDIIQLYKFREFINFDGDVFTFERKRRDKVVYCCSLNIYGCHNVLRDLNIIYNITPKKSLTLCPPNITDSDHIRSFIVGYIDGDGYIGITKNGKYTNTQLSITGTYEFLQWINKYLSLHTGITENKIHKSSAIYTVIYRGKTAETIINYLSAYSGYKMGRKWNNHAISTKTT